MNDYNFGNFVCMLREKKGLTQADVAGMLGVTAAAVSKWENGSSKPRVEVLFKLAEILEVRPEELMAGHYIEGSKLDPEAVKNINERYEYLRRIDAYNTTETKIRRLAAALCDWLIIGGAELLILMAFVFAFFDRIEANDQGIALLMMPIMLAYPLIFVLRDVIFGKRSLGKRIFGLVILDKKTAETAKASARVLKNILNLFISEIDAIVLLISGLTVGDRLANTVTVPLKAINRPDDDETEARKINSYTPPSPIGKKTVIGIVCVIIAAAILLVGLIAGVVFAALDSSKDTAEYQLGYSYLIESDKFAELGLTEDDIRFNSYRRNITTNADGVKTVNVELGFRIGFGRSMYVICHDDGEGWYVCEECTKFE